VAYPRSVHSHGISQVRISRLGAVEKRSVWLSAYRPAFDTKCRRLAVCWLVRVLFEKDWHGVVRASLSADPTSKLLSLKWVLFSSRTRERNCGSLSQLSTLSVAEAHHMSWRLQGSNSRTGSYSASHQPPPQYYDHLLTVNLDRGSRSGFLSPSLS
jgi:hypothetical protein